MVSPWTQRERALRAALEFALKVSEMVRNGTAHELQFTPDEFLSKLRSALADVPPPDPRDKALELAEVALHTCHSTHDGRYPLYYELIRAAITAIREAKEAQK